MKKCNKRNKRGINSEETEVREATETRIETIVEEATMTIEVKINDNMKNKN